MPILVAWDEGVGESQMGLDSLPSGSPLSVALIGVVDLERSLEFYSQRLGLDVATSERLAGPDFERYWRLPEGTAAECVLLGAGPDAVGRVLLMQFDASREPIRAASERHFYGLTNLNFYVEDVMSAVGEFREEGYRFWSMPVSYHLADSVGAPTEVVFEGPDGILINLVELSGGGPGTRIDEMAEFVASYREAGEKHTPVVTSAHTVRSRDKAVRFYEEVIGMRVFIDEVVGDGAANHLLSLPEGSQTQITFLRGSHLFGKLVLAQPLNYECVDLSRRAAAPNIGYLCQSFEVPDIFAAVDACQSVAAEIVSPVAERRLPGFGERRSMLVRCPGSGALQELVESLPQQRR